MTDHIVVERRGAVQAIRINRPEKKNALTRAMYATMSAALREGDADPAIRCHVFLGVPGAFSAGNDLADFLVIATGGEGGGEVWDFLLALAGAQKPIVSGVDGIAVGIGTTLNLHCDLTFATSRTVFRTPFVDLGLVPEAGSSLLLPRRIGPAKAAEMLMLGRRIDADEALAIGLINELIDTDHVIPHTLELTHKLAAKPRLAMQAARRLAHGDKSELLARVEEESRLFGEALQSEEARLAFTAFMSRPKN